MKIDHITQKCAAGVGTVKLGIVPTGADHEAFGKKEALAVLWPQIVVAAKTLARQKSAGNIVVKIHTETTYTPKLEGPKNDHR